MERNCVGSKLNLGEARSPFESVYDPAWTKGVVRDAGATRQLLGHAIAVSQCVQIGYRDAENRPSVRRIRPFELFQSLDFVRIAAWCENRENFRQFRGDRIVYARLCDDYFTFEVAAYVALWEDLTRGKRPWPRQPMKNLVDIPWPGIRLG